MRLFVLKASPDMSKFLLMGLYLAFANAKSMKAGASRSSDVHTECLRGVSWCKRSKAFVDNDGSAVCSVRRTVVEDSDAKSRVWLDGRGNFLRAVNVGSVLKVVNYGGFYGVDGLCCVMGGNVYGGF